jgi:hypothetical protein
VFTVPDKDGKADPLGECTLGQVDQELSSLGWWPKLTWHLYISSQCTCMLFVVYPLSRPGFHLMVQSSCLSPNELCIPGLMGKWGRALS